MTEGTTAPGTSPHDATVVDGALGPGPSSPVPAAVGRYRIDAVLGEGGMGTVYRAFDDRLDRPVALKVLHRHGHDAQGIERLSREALALASLAHPNVVAVFEVRLDHTPPFVVMEYVEGETLGAWMNPSGHGPRPWRQVLAMFDAAGRGLAAAHDCDIVHRDFKPHNVLVGTDGRPRVLDFGLAAPSMSAGGESTTTGSEEPSDLRLTQTGTVLGTPAYMASEQHTGDPVDARSDQFAFCVTLFEALYGQRPFAGSTAKELFVGIARGRIVVPKDAPALPRGLLPIVTRGLADDPADRWPDMTTLLAALARVDRRPRWVWGAAALVGLGALGLTGWALRPAACEPADVLAQQLWSPAQQDAVAHALAQSGVENAELVSRVNSGIGQFAQGLAEASHQLCVDAAAAEDRRPLDARGICLAQRRLEFRALIDVLSEAGPSLEASAPRAVSTLTPVQACDAATGQPTVPAPIAEAVADLRQSMATVGALEAAGRYEEGSVSAAAAVDRARALDHSPVLAEALLHAGRLQAAAGRYPPSRELLEQAYLVATEAQHDVVALEAATMLVRVVGHEMASHEDGFTWVRHARSLVERNEVGGLPYARVLRAEGSVWHSAGSYDRAAALHEQALALIEHELGPRHPEYADTLLVLGHAHWRRHDFERSTALAERARGIYTEQLGPQHPMVAEALNDLGLLASRQGHYEESMEFHRRALEIRRRTLGEEHAIVGRSYYHVGMSQLRLGQYEGMVEALRRAVAIREKAYGERHPDVIGTRGQLARAMALDGDPQAGTALAERAADDIRDVYAPDHPRIYSTVHRAAEVAILAGDTASARRHLDALEHSHPERIQQAEFFVARGDVELLDGDPRAAREHYEHAETLLQSLPPQSLDRVATLVGLARACMALDQPECARDALRRAEGLEVRAPRQLQQIREIRAQLATP